eukprot:c36140_g1_i1 orf=3-266(-)
MIKFSSNFYLQFKEVLPMANLHFLSINYGTKTSLSPASSRGHVPMIYPTSVSNPLCPSTRIKGKVNEYIVLLLMKCLIAFAAAVFICN